MLMGTVILCLTDDNGVKHTFMLIHVNYMPKSPVNILSTRVLSKQFPNENGFDQQGTRITSVFDDHTFFGIMVDFARPTRLTLLAFRNCFLTLVTLNYSLSQHFCSHTMTTRFTGLLYWNLKERLFLNQIKAMQSLQILMPELHICREMEM